MSQVYIPGSYFFYPQIRNYTTPAFSGTTLNAAGETMHMIGNVILQNPLSSSKTISAAGGGRIVWRSGAVTFSNAGTTFRVGIQDVSTVNNPGQGDGTFDVEAVFTGGGGGVTANAKQTSTMTTGTKTIANGDLIAISISMSARGGTDSVVVQCISGDTTFPNTTRIPCVTDNTGGTYVGTTKHPNAYIIFDDGTIGSLFGCVYYDNTGNVAYNSGTATADEYGNLIYSPATFHAFGIAMTGVFTTTSTTELLLYSDPLGTPVAEKTITLNPVQFYNVTAGYVIGMFASPFIIKANTNYVISARPTTANSITLYYYDNDGVSGGGVVSPPNATCSAYRRLDNTGAFSAYNGGTANSRAMSIHLCGTYKEQGVNVCSGQVGVF